MLITYNEKPLKEIIGGLVYSYFYCGIDPE